MAFNRKSLKFKIGFFPGVWDLCHIGHIRAIQEAKNKCDWLIIGVNGSPTKGNPKKNKPIMSWQERMEMVKSIKGVDEVLLYPDDEVLRILDKKNPLKIDIRFMGADHRGKKHHKINAKIIYISRNHDYSSTKLRKRIYEAKII